MDNTDSDRIQSIVRQKYGEIAASVTAGVRACCGPSCCSTTDPVSGDLYTPEQKTGIPPAALTASLGCGNPTALLDLREGDTVLDLGSGGGIDVLLTARRVGPAGKVYGLDMTDEMLALARENQRKAGATNIEFLKGDIQSIPLPSNSIDVVISNCVINLAPDKSQVLTEAFRVLKPGGRFAVSDVVALGDVSPALRENMEAWAGCIAGALDAEDYRRKMQAAGFEDVHLETWRVYDDVATGPAGRFASAFIRGTKPTRLGIEMARSGSE